MKTIRQKQTWVIADNVKTERPAAKCEWFIVEAFAENSNLKDVFVKQLLNIEFGLSAKCSIHTHHLKSNETLHENNHALDMSTRCLMEWEKCWRNFQLKKLNQPAAPAKHSHIKHHRQNEDGHQLQKIPHRSNLMRSLKMIAWWVEKLKRKISNRYKCIKHIRLFPCPRSIACTTKT